MLVMCEKIKDWKSKGWFDPNSKRYSPALYKVFVEDGGLVLDHTAELNRLKDQVRNIGVFDGNAFNERYVYDPYFRARGMGQAIPNRAQTHRLEAKELVAQIRSAEESDPVRVKVKVYLEMKKAHLLRKSEGLLLDLSKAPSDEEVDAYVSGHRSPDYARWIVSSLRANNNGCSGPRDDRGSCPGFFGPGSGSSGMDEAGMAAPKAAAVAQVMQAAHVEEGTEKQGHPSNLNQAELAAEEEMLPLCLNCHSMETGTHNRVERSAASFGSQAQNRLSNQCDFNSVKIRSAACRARTRAPRLPRLVRIFR